MLPERVQYLVAAYIDGELSPRQRRTVEALLRTSTEAQALAQQLRHDADLLRALPRQQLDGHFADRVFEHIHSHGVAAVRQRRTVAARWLARPWFSVAIAASVLVVISVSTVVHLKTSSPDNHQDLLASANRTNASISSSTQSANESTRTERYEQLSKEPEASSTPIAQKSEQTSPMHPNRQATEVPQPILLGTPALPRERLEVFKPQLSLILSLDNLNRRQLREELNKDAAFRVELFCTDHTRAFDRVQDAFKTSGVRLIVDQTAQARLKRGLATRYVVYSEDMVPDELTSLLAKLGEQKGNELKRRFDRVVLGRLSAQDHVELSGLLGVELAQLQPQRPKTPLSVDLRKPLSEGTADQVTQQLAGQGGKAGEMVKADRLALVLSQSPVRTTPSTSKEVKQFLGSRKDRRVGALQLYFVIHETGS